MSEGDKPSTFDEEISLLRQLRKEAIAAGDRPKMRRYTRQIAAVERKKIRAAHLAE
jgi:hypothetical protein